MVAKKGVEQHFQMVASGIYPSRRDGKISMHLGLWRKTTTNVKLGV
jgi:hypothetical protein